MLQNQEPLLLIPAQREDPDADPLQHSVHGLFLAERALLFP
jgi:hypothetical protein